MRGCAATRRHLVSLTVMFLLAGCSAGATPAPTATPTAAHSPSATAAKPVTAVTGSGESSFADLGKTTTDADGVTHYRGGTFRFTVTTDDARVSGTEAALWNMDLWGTADNGANVQWGTSRLENDGGAWEGKGSGVYSSDRGDIIAFWYQGTGGYAGLGYFALWTGKGPWNIRGQVFPGDPPNLAAMPALPPAKPEPSVLASPATSLPPLPTAIAHGPVSVITGTHAFTSMNAGTSTSGPAGVTSYRDGTFTGIDRANDPRVGFTWTGSPWAMDIWGTFASGGGTEWGVDRGVNADGAWECSGSGIFDSKGGDAIAIWCKGTGGYAGLAYFELITLSDPFGLIQSDDANRAINGAVFPGNPPTP